MDRQTDGISPACGAPGKSRRLRQVGADLEGIKKFIGPKGEKVRVGDLLDSLQLDFEIRHKLSPQITSKLKPLRAAFGDCPARDLTDAMVAQYVRARQQGVPENTLAGSLSAIERRWKARRWQGPNGEWNLSPFVFFRTKGRGVPNGGATVKEFRKSWKATCEAAGLPGRLFHDFRRTGARNMRRAGVAEEVAMKITGHKTPSMCRSVSAPRHIFATLTQICS